MLPRRLSPTGSSDRVNIKSWIGSRVLPDVSLREIYMRGRDQAMKVLNQHPHYKVVASRILRKAIAEGRTLLRVFGPEPVGVKTRCIGTDVSLGGIEEADEEHDEGPFSLDGASVEESVVNITAGADAESVSMGEDQDEMDRIRESERVAQADLSRELTAMAEDTASAASRVAAKITVTDGNRKVDMHPAAALKYLAKSFGLEGKVKSGDRNSRVMGLSKGAATSGQINSSSSSAGDMEGSTVINRMEEERVNLGDPVVCLVQTGTEKKANADEEGRTMEVAVMHVAVGIVSSLRMERQRGTITSMPRSSRKRPSSP